MPIKNFIDGIFVEPDSNEYLTNHNPATGKELTKIPNSNLRDVARAVEAAELAAPKWQKLTVNQRIDWLRKIAASLEMKKEHVASVESIDTGKPISLARRVDAARSVANFEFFAEYAGNLPKLTFAMTDAVNYVVRKPVGVVGLITPWNLPLYLLTWKIAPALVMGNTIVAKPSELTPLSANLFAEILAEINFPKGVFNLIHGLGSNAGQAIVEHPGVKAISFTGGTTTGKVVARTAAPMFKKLSLELGGKNSTVILQDADLPLAASGAAKAAFTNSGQICLCGSRILIDAKIYDKFTSLLIEEVSSLKIGDPELENTEIGSVISHRHLEKIMSYIELAKEEGGIIIHGGKIIEMQNPKLAGGAFVYPTIIENLPIDSRCATEEIFGPVVTLHRFDDEAQAITMINNTEYGLSGSVWTTDLNRGRRFAEQIDSGVLWVNTWLHRDLRTPFGGVKNSGMGREGGMWSLDFFSELSNICVKDD